ncbi:hypothetical protein RhiirC2_768440 [Rhizophagus irregularis]|uniref:Uncharacterized protein n=1 Tax=Rhizophagus irregularis TaxID=588596 RepID=A0A2N1P1V1_9GLOM|nr:hypothetical protein RhiirC2_768440 [Rhizophagus irregularis]
MGDTFFGYIFVDKVNETSTEEGFIKSFISSGLSPLQTSITDCLEQRKADVAGLYQPLNPSMNEIQQAITKCIEACLSEQKRGMEIGSKTKLIVNDLTTLRKLLGYDCVSFNSFLETIITSQTPTSALSQQQESPWLSLDAVAKRCVFVRTSTTNPTDNTQKNSYSNISDIKITSGYTAYITSHATETSRNSSEEDLDHLNNTILIMMENEREYSQLREYLSTMHIAERQGLDKSSIMLERLLKNYLNGKVSKNLFNENGKERCKEVNSLNLIKFL